MPRLITERQLVPVWHAFYDYPLTEAYLMQSDKTKLFIEKARAVHGDRYNYSRVEYVSAHGKVKIICADHGVFKQAPTHHLSAKGCSHCAVIAKIARCKLRNTLAREGFLVKAAVIHGDRYCYSDAVYRKAKDKITIICTSHGPFEQTPDSHLSGKGCTKCGIEHNAAMNRLKAIKSGGSFIKKSIAVHGDRYDYSRVIYVDNRTKVSISCADHGDFQQVPNSHLSGSGCPSCNFDREQPTHLYALSNGKGQCKIGISIDPDVRLSEINRGAPFVSTFKASWVLPNFRAAYEVEQHIHKQLKHLNCGYEGFSGCTEWFNIKPHQAVKIAEKAIDQVQQLALL